MIEEDDGLAPQERVAKMLVDHLIKFNGCECDEHIHQYDEETNMTMSQFIAEREQIFEPVPELVEPDFAQNHRLPEEVRLYPVVCKDEWMKHLKDRLNHMTPEQWNEHHWDKVEELFTGGSEPRNLRIGKDDDITFSRNKYKRQIARGQTTVDIDSILALFTDLSMVNILIRISIVSNPTKNLRFGMHLFYKGLPVHHIPHFYLGSFGHDSNYDLFVMLPALYIKDVKRTKGYLRNDVSEEIRAEFMQKCFLPVIREVVSQQESQSWDFNYNISKAKSTAAAKEGN